MNTTKIPGFTAEASIYKTVERYRMAGIMIPVDTVTSSIAPAAFLAAPAPREKNGGASCFCPCCIISGGILWCC